MTGKHWTCDNCGSSNVQAHIWIDINSPDFNDEILCSMDKCDLYCKDCDETKITLTGQLLDETNQEV